MEHEKHRIIQDILDLSEHLYDMATPNLPREWLTLNLTMPQVRILLLLHREGPSRMGDLASTSGIALSTATSTVDHLVGEGLVVRESDPRDRRLVICRLSSKGQELASELWKLGRFQIERLLELLSDDQLRAVQGAVRQAVELLRSVSKASKERS